MQSKIQRDIRKDKETNRRFWQAHVKAWRRSGYSRAEYCRLYNLSYDTLTYWQERTGIEAPPGTANPIVAVAQIPARQFSLQASATSSLIIDLQGRFKIEVAESFSQATLVRLITTLEGC